MKKLKPTTDKPTVPGTDLAILPALVPLLVPIEDVHPDPANPRITRDLDTLKASLRRFGVRKPIVANSRDARSGSSTASRAGGGRTPASGSTTVRWSSATGIASRTACAATSSRP